VTISVPCPRCSVRMTLDNDRAERSLECPRCGHAIVLPARALEFPQARPTSPSVWRGTLLMGGSLAAGLLLLAVVSLVPGSPRGANGSDLPGSGADGPVVPAPNREIPIPTVRSEIQPAVSASGEAPERATSSRRTVSVIGATAKVGPGPKTAGSGGPEEDRHPPGAILASAVARVPGSCGRGSDPLGASVRRPREPAHGDHDVPLLVAPGDRLQSVRSACCELARVPAPGRRAPLNSVLDERLHLAMRNDLVRVRHRRFVRTPDRTPVPVVRRVRAGHRDRPRGLCRVDRLKSGCAGGATRCASRDG